MRIPKKDNQIPKGMTEQEFLDIVAKVSFKPSFRFRFGYMTAQDLQQELWVLLTERKDGKPSIMDRYDNSRPLENFLRVAIPNKLKNYKRDNYERIYELKCACKLCKQKIEHEARLSCLRYKQWYFRNIAKKNVLLPIDIDNVNNEKEENMSENTDINDKIDHEEIFRNIDMKLPVNMRADYIKMKSGGKLGKTREEEILTKIREILNVRIKS